MTQNRKDVNHRGDFNYENCIVTHHEDSTDSEESFHLPNYEPCDNSKQPNPEHDVFDPVMYLTAEHVAANTLSVEETFSLVLVLATRMENYLNNLQENEHRKWLKEKINILKTVLIKNFSCTIDEAETIGGSVHSKKSNLGNSCSESWKKRSRVKRRTSVQLRKRNETELDLGERLQTSVSPKRRRSLRQRNQQQVESYTDKREIKVPKDHQLVYMDKLTYQHYMSETAKTNNLMKSATPKRNKKSDNAIRRARSLGAASTQRGKVAKKSDNATPDNKRINKKRTKSLGAQLKKIKLKKDGFQPEQGSTTELKTSANATTKKNSNRRKAQSFSSQGTVEKNQTKSTKRRAVSLGRATKKIKTINSFEQSDKSNTDTLSTVSSGRRKLYSPAEWLHSLSTVMTQTT